MWRKTFLSFCGFFILLASTAQNVTISDSSNLTIQRWRDTSFALLNLTTSQIPSGFLLDYSLNAFNDSNYNSLISTKIDTISDAGVLLALCGILNASVVNSTASAFGSTDSIFINAYRYRRNNNGTIPLLFVYRTYQKIRKTAYTQNLLSFTTDSVRLKDVAGRASSPYDNEYIFAFSSFQNKINQSGAINFALPASFWMMPGVTSVQVDFGDGVGYRTLSQNGTVTINYPSTATYYLNAKITTSAGTFTAKSSIQYTKPTYYVKADSSWTISVPPLYASISDYLSAHQGFLKTQGVAQPLSNSESCLDGSIYDMANCDVNPGAQVLIMNGCDRVFDNPIIIVEGFDPSNKTTTNTLQNYVDNTASPAGLGFFTTMRQAGYDFVFVIFNDNTDFIENNAKVLEQVITRVNNAKRGTNKNTIIGFSMGGLITQWALKDMENQGIAHQVGSYFSYDAPHQGANTPLGLQYLFVNMLKDMPYLKSIGGIGTLYASFTSKAAQEMLVTYATGSSGTPVNAVRTAFAQSLIDMGYPQNCNNYGISQGRGNNTSGTTSAGNGTQFGGFTGGTAIFNGGLDHFLINMVTTVYAVNSTTTGPILNYLYFGYKVAKVFGFIPWPTYSIRPVIVNYKSPYPYDDAPGGYENTQAQFVDNFNNKFTLLGVTFNNRGIASKANDNGHYGHCFVPVASALDLQNQGYGSTNSYQSNNMYYAIDNNIVSPAQLTGNTLSPTTLSPFKAVMTYTADCATDFCSSSCWDDDYIYVNNIPPSEGASWNQWHEGDLSSQTQLFIQRKILATNTFPACSINTDFCPGTTSSIAISGPTYLCNTGSFTLGGSYPLQNLTFQWSFPNGTLQVTSGQGTPTITVSEIYSNTETVTCKVINSCGLSTTYTYNVTVGSVLSGNVSNGGSNFPMTTVNSVAAGSTLVTFQWPGASGISCVQSSTNPPVSQTGFIYNSGNSSFGFTLASGQTINVQLNATGCGGTLSATRTFTVGGHQFVVSPNPASGTVSVSSVAQQTAELKTQVAISSGTIRQIIVMDAAGVAHVQQPFAAGTTRAQFSVASLVPGTYFVEISDGQYTETQQLVISR